MITIIYKTKRSEEFDSDEVSFIQTGNFLVLDYRRLNVDIGIDEIWKTRYIPIEKIDEVIVS